MQILEDNNMTIDEAVDGFLRWLIRDTRAALEWAGIEEQYREFFPESIGTYSI